MKWIDRAFTNHVDMHSHTGGTLSLGHGVIYATSTCQNLNTWSLTEAEIVAVDDCMGQVVWMQYFLGAQGYQVDDVIM